MTIRFEGEFSVPGRPKDVLERFADVERMVTCMPGASIEGTDEEGNFLGVMVVSFGPKKLTFRGKITNTIDQPHLTGTLLVRGAAQLRSAARVNALVTYSLREAADSDGASTLVALVSEAEMGGVLADFAQTGGIAVTKALMDQFAIRAAEEFGREAAAQSDSSGLQGSAAPPARSPPHHALAAHTVVWAMLKSAFSSWIRRLTS